MKTNHETYPKTHSIFHFLNKEVEELEIKLINFLLRAWDLKGGCFTIRNLVDPRDELGGEKMTKREALALLPHGNHAHAAEELGPSQVTPPHLKRQLNFLLTGGEREKNSNRLVEPIKSFQLHPDEDREDPPDEVKKIRNVADYVKNRIHDILLLVPYVILTAGG